MEYEKDKNANIGVILSRMERKEKQPKEKNFVERLNAIAALKEDYINPGILRWTLRNGGDITIRIMGETIKTSRIEFQGIGNRQLYILDGKGLKAFNEAQAETLEILQ